jgi:signal transduction histidine kinase
MLRNLSSKLLILTVGFVMLAEVMIFVPSIAIYRANWLEDHLASGQIAGLALEASPQSMVSVELEEELLANARVSGVMLNRGESRILMLGKEAPEPTAASYDLRSGTFGGLMADALTLIFRGPEGTIEVTGAAVLEGGEYVSILVDEAFLYNDLTDYARTLLLMSIAITIATAISLYFAMAYLFIRPMENLTQKMVEFSQKPEDISRIIKPSDRNDEIGTAEHELKVMQEEISQALVQKTRLANLGQAMARINHDLRNILTTVHLVSGRLSQSDDPRVQNLSGTLMSGIERAIDMCTQTLSYGKPQNIIPRPILFELGPIADEVGNSLSLNEGSDIRFINRVPHDFQLYADPDQIFRALTNLARNAYEAMEDEGEGTITISLAMENDFDVVIVEDTGPGLPEKAREFLFEPFQGSTRQGGTGLGLANVKEVIAAHGGEVRLEKSESTGTIFCLALPHDKGK